MVSLECKSVVRLKTPKLVIFGMGWNQEQYYSKLNSSFQQLQDAAKF